MRVAGSVDVQYGAAFFCADRYVVFEFLWISDIELHASEFWFWFSAFVVTVFLYQVVFIFL